MFAGYHKTKGMVTRWGDELPLASLVGMARELIEHGDHVQLRCAAALEVMAGVHHSWLRPKPEGSEVPLRPTTLSAAAPERGAGCLLCESMDVGTTQFVCTRGHSVAWCSRCERTVRAGCSRSAFFRPDTECLLNLQRPGVCAGVCAKAVRLVHGVERSLCR